MFNLYGKTAVITGGSRGIGRAIALGLASHGSKIIILYSQNQDAANETKQMIEDTGTTCDLYRCDISDSHMVKQIVSDIVTQHGSPHILINNAGIVRDALVLTMSEQDFDDVISTNLKGAFNLIRFLSPHFLRLKTGRIINIASVSGITGNIGQANYSAAKAGLIGLTKTVARELASRGITCNAIAPGFTETDMTSKIKSSIKDILLASIPIKRFAKPEDIAALAIFLASDVAGYITGEVIKVDGGMCM